ncbi:MAG TPA: NmrA family NAD(P)-binding protein [Thermoguttaceae bacterium]|nr:NmrA family NAD(P)-binding protein [Thermoguttaceae bacterium]
MKIAVTTPTGHVGGAVGFFLLNAGANVRLLTRRPEKLKEFADRGAEILRGPQDDQDFVNRSTQGVDALLWVTPPGYGSDDVRAFQTRLGKVAAEAIRINRIPRVVNISSIGAQNFEGVGPIGGLHDVEQLLDETAENILQLRPGFFYENYFWFLDGIRKMGSVFMPVSGSTRYPMLATRDVARVAADWLLNAKWTGHVVRELHGPKELSFDEAAAELSEGMHREIRHVKIDRDQARQTMMETGMSDNAVDLMLELYDAIETGMLTYIQPITAETRTSTELVDFAREVLLPVIGEPVPH